MIGFKVALSAFILLIITMFFGNELYSDNNDHMAPLGLLVGLGLVVIGGGLMWGLWAGGANG